MPNLLLGVLRPAIVGPPVTGLAGYVCGGEEEFLGTPTDTVFKVALPIDTWSTTTSAPDVILLGAGFSDDGVAGYCGQGEFSDELYKWTLPTDSSSRTTDIPQVMEFFGAFSNRGVAGYMASGDGSSFTDLYRLAYPTDSFTSPTSTTVPQENNGGDADPGVAGYMPRNGLIAPNGVWNKVALPTESFSFIGTFLFRQFTEAPSVFCDPGVRIYATSAIPEGFMDLNTLSLPTDSAGVDGISPGPDQTLFMSGFANDGVAGYAQIGFDESGSTSFVSDEVYKKGFTTGTSSVAPNMPGVKAGAGAFANMG